MLLICDFSLRFQEPSQRDDSATPLRRRISSIQEERVRAKLSRQNTQPLPTISDNPDKGCVQRKPSNIKLKTVPSQKKWRKPHRKQSTIRAIGRMVSMMQRSGTLRKTSVSCKKSALKRSTSTEMQSYPSSTVGQLTRSDTLTL